MPPTASEAPATMSPTMQEASPPHAVGVPGVVATAIQAIETPDQSIPIVHPAYVQVSAAPWRVTATARPERSVPRKAPNVIVPESRPATAALPPTTVIAIAGNSACGNRKTIAHTSSTNVIEITGDRRTNPKPSMTAFTPRAGAVPSCSGTWAGSL